MSDPNPSLSCTPTGAKPRSAVQAPFSIPNSCTTPARAASPLAPTSARSAVMAMADPKLSPALSWFEEVSVESYRYCPPASRLNTYTAPAGSAGAFGAAPRPPPPRRPRPPLTTGLPTSSQSPAAPIAFPNRASPPDTSLACTEAARAQSNPRFAKTCTTSAPAPTNSRDASSFSASADPKLSPTFASGPVSVAACCQLPPVFR